MSEGMSRIRYVTFISNAHAFEKQSFSMSQRPLVFVDFQACDGYMVNQRFTCIGGTSFHHI